MIACARVAGAVVACTVAVTACSDPAFHCTPEAVAWHVTVLDADGIPVTDLVWTSVIVGADDTIAAAALNSRSDPANGRYAIFVDAARDRIDPAGELVRVEGVSGLDWFRADFVFDLPDPECHVNRRSGPDTVTLAPAPFALGNADRVWGGGEILVVSPVHRLLGDSLLFLVEDDTVWSSPMAGDTAAIRAPVYTGTYAVAVMRAGVADSLGTASVRGYAGAAEGPPLTGQILAWPQGSKDPTFLANGPNQLHLVDAASRTVVRAFDDSIHNPSSVDPDLDPRDCMTGPFPAYASDVVTLCPERRTAIAYDLGEAPPRRVEELCTWNDGWPAAPIAPGRWLVGTHHSVRRIQCPEGTSFAPDIGLEQTEWIRFSPQGDRIVPLGNLHEDGGVPVLDGDGAIVFRISELQDLGAPAGVGFSGDGSTVYAAMSYFTENVTRVVSVDALSGTTLAQTAFPGRSPSALLVDWGGGWVYVLVRTDIASGRAWVLSVLDRGSLATVAVLEPGPGSCSPGWPVELILGVNQSAVFAVHTHDYWQRDPQENSFIQRFDVGR